MYQIIMPNLKDATKFNRTEHPLELELTKFTEIEKIEDDNSTPCNFLELRKLEEVKDMGVNSDVSVLGIVKNIQGPKIIETQDGRKIIKTDF